MTNPLKNPAACAVNTNTPAVKVMLNRLALDTAWDKDTAELRGDLSEYGIKTLRDYADAMGWSRTDLGTLLVEELARCRAAGCTPDEAGMVLYFRARRSGSRFLLSRAMRVAVFAQLVGKRAVA